MLKINAMRWRHFYLDRLVQIFVYLAVFLVCAVFLWILIDLLRGGFVHISWDFLIESPRDASRAGGIGSILVSTTLILLVALGAACITIGVDNGGITCGICAHYQ